jgi:hypothetical protein
MGGRCLGGLSERKGACDAMHSPVETENGKSTLRDSLRNLVAAQKSSAVARQRLNYPCLWGSLAVHRLVIIAVGHDMP